jgi:hypothetical protein
MIRFGTNAAANTPGEPAQSSLANNAVDAAPESAALSADPERGARSTPEPLELSSDLPKRKGSKRRPAAPKRPRTNEATDPDNAPLVLNLDT